MPISVKIDWESPSLVVGANGSDGLVANVKGAATKGEAIAAVVALSPTTLNGFIRSNLSADELGPGVHKVAVAYATTGPGGGDTPAGETPPDPGGEGEPPEPVEPGDVPDSSYEFGFTAEMKHRNQSLGTLYRRKRGDALNAIGTAPDYRRAVGISRSGGAVKVDGYDAPESTATWSKTVPMSNVTYAYLDAVEALVGLKNDAPFFNRPAGTTVLMGASGRSTAGAGNFSITFQFAVRKNLDDYVISPDPDDPYDPETEEPDKDLPGALVIPFASGWDHVWVEFKEDTADNELIKRPVYAYVEKVVHDGDFSLLRIGT